MSTTVLLLAYITTLLWYFTHVIAYTFSVPEKQNRIDAASTALCCGVMFLWSLVAVSIIL